MFILWSYSSFDKIWLFYVILNKLEVASKEKSSACVFLSLVTAQMLVLVRVASMGCSGQTVNRFRL